MQSVVVSATFENVDDKNNITASNNQLVATLTTPAVANSRSNNAAPIVDEPDHEGEDGDEDEDDEDIEFDDDDDDAEQNDDNNDDDERCTFDWDNVSPTTPRTDYVYEGDCEYSLDRSAHCFLCMARLKFAHVLTHSQCNRALIGADCLERLLANNQATNRGNVAPKYLNRMLKLFAGPWTQVSNNELSICKRFRAGSAWSRELAAGQSIEIRCGINRTDASKTWAGFRLVGKQRQLRFFDDLRFPRRQQICTVAFQAPKRVAKPRPVRNRSRNYFRKRYFARQRYSYRSAYY